MNSLIMVVHNVPYPEPSKEILNMTRYAVETLIKTAVDEEYELILADNGSHDEGITMDAINAMLAVKGKESKKELFYGENKSLAFVWNDIIRNWASGDTFILLNNDVIFNNPGWQSALTGPLKVGKHVAVTGSNTMSWNGQLFLEGAFLAFRRDFVDKLTLKDGYIFDEQFEFTCEDVDLCIRAQKMGMTITPVHIEQVGLVTHLSHRTMGALMYEGGWNGKNPMDIMHESRLKLCRKHGLPERIND